MSFKELKQNTLKVSFLHCDGVIWCRDTGIINIWDLITYLSNEKFVKAVFTLAADFVFSHAVQFLRSLGFMLLCLDCQTCFWASVWAPRCLELLLPAFFFCLPQLALLSAGSFSPTPWASSVLWLQPSRSVSRSVSHWRSWGLRLLSGSESFSYLSVCCSSRISRWNLLFPNWAQLNTLLTLRPSACFSFISLKTLCDSHSLQLIIFTFFFVSREFSVEILTSRFVTLSSASHSPLWVLGKVPEL